MSFDARGTRCVRRLCALAAFVAATPLAAQSDSSASPAVRRLVLAGIVHALVESIVDAAQDTTPRAWDLFPHDTTGTWGDERRVLERLLRARPRTSADRSWGVLSVPRLVVQRDTIEARFTISTAVPCARGRTANGITLLLRVPRTEQPDRAIPVITSYWDGLPCSLLDTLTIREAPKPPR